VTIEKREFMALHTSNSYGKITISNNAIAAVANHTALECYGIVELVSNTIFSSFSELLTKNKKTKGVKVKTVSNRIYIDISLKMKYGVSISAVAESLKEAVKYKVEKFSGMIVNSVNINIIGIAL